MGIIAITIKGCFKDTNNMAQIKNIIANIRASKPTDVFSSPKPPNRLGGCTL